MAWLVKLAYKLKFCLGIKQISSFFPNIAIILSWMIHSKTNKLLNDSNSAEGWEANLKGASLPDPEWRMEIKTSPPDPDAASSAGLPRSFSSKIWLQSWAKQRLSIRGCCTQCLLAKVTLKISTVCKHECRSLKLNFHRQLLQTNCLCIKITAFIAIMFHSYPNIERSCKSESDRVRFICSF